MQAIQQENCPKTTYRVKKEGIQKVNEHMKEKVFSFISHQKNTLRQQCDTTTHTKEWLKLKTI